MVVLRRLIHRYGHSVVDSGKFMESNQINTNEIKNRLEAMIIRRAKSGVFLGFYILQNCIDSCNDDPNHTRSKVSAIGEALEHLARFGNKAVPPLDR
jgi:hypothetical protein